jgi:hypothetical protein
MIHKTQLRTFTLLQIIIPEIIILLLITIPTEAAEAIEATEAEENLIVVEADTEITLIALEQNMF